MRRPPSSRSGRVAAALLGLALTAGLAACESGAAPPAADGPTAVLDLSAPELPEDLVAVPAEGTGTEATDAHLGAVDDPLGGAAVGRIGAGEVLTVPLTVPEEAAVVVGASGGGTDVDLVLTGDGTAVGNADSGGELDVLGFEQTATDPVWAGVLAAGEYTVHIVAPGGGTADVTVGLLASTRELYGSASGIGTDLDVAPGAPALVRTAPTGTGGHLWAGSGTIDPVLHVVAPDGSVWRVDDAGDPADPTAAEVVTGTGTEELVVVVTSADTGWTHLVAHDTPPLL